MSALVKFDFYGDSLDVAKDGETVFVALRPMCAALGISFEPQLTKLKSKPWATMTMIITVADDGKPREMAALHLDSIPMWLAGIEPTKVKEHARGKLVRYQMECARVLRDHFMPARSVASSAPTTTGPIQARIGDDAIARGCLSSMCIAAARVSGRTVQSIHGELRKPWGVASVYRIALTSYDHTFARVQEIIDGAMNIRRLPAHKRQVAMPWGPS